MSKPVVTLPIRGINHRLGAYQAAKVEPGDVLHLRWDTENAYDPWAIAAMKGRTILGYLPKEDTARLHRFRELEIKLLVVVEMCDEASCRVRISAESDPVGKPVDFDCLDRA
jgi:hypothetical protein